MGDGGNDDEMPEEDGRQVATDRDRWVEAVSRTEGYETDSGKWVAFDAKNPLAWILSDESVPLPDQEDEDPEDGDEEAGS